MSAGRCIARTSTRHRILSHATVLRLRSLVAGTARLGIPSELASILAPHEGWQLHAGGEPRPTLVARGSTPSWLPKLLDLSGEC